MDSEVYMLSKGFRFRKFQNHSAAVFLNENYPLNYQFATFYVNKMLEQAFRCFSRIKLSNKFRD